MILRLSISDYTMGIYVFTVMIIAVRHVFKLDSSGEIHNVECFTNLAGLVLLGLDILCAWICRTQKQRALN